MKEMMDMIDEMLASKDKLLAIKDKRIEACGERVKNLQEWNDYQEEDIERKTAKIEQLRMALFVERRKNLVIDKKTVDKLKNKVKECFGTQNKFAKQLGVSKSIASKWLNGQEVIPFKRAEQIEVLTNGVIKKTEATTIQ
jgi:DNA-binding transcriptional regulator YiaG